MGNILAISPKSESPKVLKARGISCRKASKTKRDLLAVDVGDGVLKLEDFSLQQLSRLFGVSTTYILAARKLSVIDRYLIEAGQRKLAEFLPQPDPAKKIAQVVRQVGVDEALSLLAAAE
jgi:hypothetical protein